jgi:anti-sigma factor RsiW
MNCEETDRFLDAYLDGELELSQQLELEQHLSGCPECATALEERRQFRSFFIASAPAYKAPPELRTKVEAIMRQEPERPRSDEKRFAFWRQPWLYAAALLAIGLPIAWMVFYGNRERRLAAQAVSDYTRALFVDHLCDVVSPDPQVVKPWLTAKLNFSPPVVDLSGSGYQMRGGRVDIVQNRRVATLVYKRNKDIVTLFMWPATRHRFTDSNQFINGLSICTWNDSKLNYIVVSTLGESQLDEFVRLFREKNSESQGQNSGSKAPASGVHPRETKTDPAQPLGW